MKSTKTFNWFRKIGFAEGVSFLVLLLIAMPLKYLAGMPVAVLIAGSLHGGLFIAFIIMMYLVKEQYGKTIGWMAKAVLASLLPFGTFVMDRDWKKESCGRDNLIIKDSWSVNNERYIYHTTRSEL